MLLNFKNEYVDLDSFLIHEIVQIMEPPQIDIMWADVSMSDGDLAMPPPITDDPIHRQDTKLKQLYLDRVKQRRQPVQAAAPRKHSNKQHLNMTPEEREAHLQKVFQQRLREQEEQIAKIRARKSGTAISSGFGKTTQPLPKSPQKRAVYQDDDHWTVVKKKGPSGTQRQVSNKGYRTGNARSSVKPRRF